MSFEARGSSRCGCCYNKCHDALRYSGLMIPGTIRVLEQYLDRARIVPCWARRIRSVTTWDEEVSK